ncbi:VCBS domain-containing protein [Tropicimonas sediminicola]|uniref:VCBS repeat-containing protein n=1 Tax=Tropicimonas sediminicola TaxID=1031541 RepID=A0A239KSX1_9RHOB|nr:VCBS domain-containing protein [Tropicimonas sediminicola]SNT21467.1 VCBS repeat-containing protein [Tropicimonas sediminicola]
MRSLEFTVPGLVNTIFLVEEVGDGSLRVTVSVDDTDGDIGDIRAVFLDLYDDSLLEGITITGDDVTDRKVKVDAVDSVGQDANVKGEVSNSYGRYDIGVEIGTMGMSNDDIQTTTFIIDHATEDLTIDEINWQNFAVRMTSVGKAGGPRSDSLKAGITATAAPDALDDTINVDEDSVLTPGGAGTDYPNLLTNDMLNWVDPDDVYEVETVEGLATNVGTPITVESAGGVSTQLTVYDDGKIAFDPTTDFNHLAQGASDTITVDYGIFDNNGGRDTAQFTIIVGGVNDAPVIGAGSVLSGRVDEDGEDAPTVVDGQMQASDVDDGATRSWQVDGTGHGLYGKLTIDGTGKWTYTLFNDSLPVQSLTQADSKTETFTVRVMDEFGASDTETVTITVTGSDDGPEIDNTFVGTDFNDQFLGYEENTGIDGLGGNDFLVGDYYQLRSDYTTVWNGSSYEGAWFVDNQATRTDGIGSYYALEPESTFTPAFGDDVINAGPGHDQAAGDAYGLYLSSFNSDHSVETGDDIIDGSTENDTLYGEGYYAYAIAQYGYDSTIVAGDDTVTGDSGVDTIYGEAYYLRSFNYHFGSQSGSDALIIGGSDNLSGGEDSDTIYGEGFSVEASSDQYNTTSGTAQTSTVLAGADIISGDGGNDTVYGDGYSLIAWSYGYYNTSSSSTNTVVAGNDDIAGGDGTDTLYGDGYLGQAYDYNYNSSGGSETNVIDGGDDTISGGNDGDTIVGDFRTAVCDVDYESNGTFRVTGGDDDLFGDAGNDFIYGDFIGTTARSYLTTNSAEVIAGNDTITGGTGNDEMWGDFASAAVFGGGNASIVTGADTFVMGPGSGLDTINDFELGKDQMDVSGYGITNFAGLDISDDGTNTTIDFDGTAADVDEVVLVNVVGLTTDDFSYA